MIAPEFDYRIDWANIDLRANPARYRIGVGTQGALTCLPYKLELLPMFSFADRHTGLESARRIYGKYLDYQMERDYVGMDMARKFVQLGVQRAHHYANFPSGRTTDSSGRAIAVASRADPARTDKLLAAYAFETFLRIIRKDPQYRIALEALRELGC